MKIMQIIGMLIVLYSVLQGLYTYYYFNRSAALTRHTYTGQKNIGKSTNPTFSILIDGDSVGAGVGASSFDTSVAGRIANYKAQESYVQMLNNSVSGSKMKDLVDREIPQEKYDLVVLIISSNDLFRFTNIGDFKNYTNKVLEKYSKLCDKLIIVGPGRLFDSTAIPIVLKPIYKIQSVKYADVISQSAKKFSNVIYINPLDTKVRRSEYGYTGATDGFHPNDEGHRFWFDLIRPHL